MNKILIFNFNISTNIKAFNSIFSEKFARKNDYTIVLNEVILVVNFTREGYKTRDSPKLIILKIKIKKIQMVLNGSLYLK